MSRCVQPSFPSQAWSGEFARSLRGALDEDGIVSDLDIAEAAAAMSAYLEALGRDTIADGDIHRWVFRVMRGLNWPRRENEKLPAPIREWTAAGYLSRETTSCGGHPVWVIHLERFPVVWSRAMELTLYTVLGTALAVLSPVFDAEDGDGIIRVRGLRRVMERMLNRARADRRLSRSCRDMCRTVRGQVRSVGAARRWKETPIVWTEAA